MGFVEGARRNSAEYEQTHIEAKCHKAKQDDVAFSYILICLIAYLLCSIGF